MTEKPLLNINVLITRPEDQAAHLKQQCEALGANVISFPTITILPPMDLKPMQQALDNIEQTDIAIFTSANAVFRTHEILQQKNLSKLTTIAIGPGTSKALRTHHLPVHYSPSDNFTSEGVLDLPILRNITNQKVVIFTGAGGRNLLPKTLTHRGAHVLTIATYRRQRPVTDVAPLIEQWQNAGVNVVVSSSRESLGNLFVMLGPKGASLLQRTPLIVVNRMMSLLADRLGCVGVMSIAKNATDEALLETLCQWAGEYSYAKS